MFGVIEYVLTIIFLVEIVLRLAANGLRYLRSMMRMADFIIVTISILDLWVLAPLGESGGSGMAILRITRLAKLAKVFRVVRVLEFFKPLRILVSTVAHSVGALAWSMILLFVCEVIGSKGAKRDLKCE